MVKDWTIENFESEFEEATMDGKYDLLMKALDTFDIDIPENKEILLKHKQDFKDLRDNLDIEENVICKKNIQDGKASLFKCISDFDQLNCIKGENYYIEVYDVKSVYLSNPITQSLGSDVIDKINSLTPLVTIYMDKGVGTLVKRYKMSFEDFENNFEKILK